MTRTTLFGIFVVAGRPLTAAQLVALARPLGISASNVKSHLTRMVADGSLRRSGTVRKATYVPTAAKENVIAAIRSRLDGSRAPKWDGTWLMVSLPRSEQDDEILASLWLDGFRPCGGNTFLRPAWQVTRASRGICVRGELTTPIDVAKLFGLDALDRRATRLAEWIERQTIAALADAKAFALRLRVGGRVASLMAHDPRLPPELWGRRRGMRRLARAYRRFERRAGPRAERYMRSI